MAATKHSDTCKRVFSRYDLTCPRCRELADGAQPREGWGDRQRKHEAARVRAIRAHDCKRSGCGPICTFGDW
jgi:hypothetical protein